MVGELLSGDPAGVGPYRLLGRLGTGGMGQVFMGQSPGGRLVAVKVIRPELAGEPGFRKRFAREVAAARNVSGLFTALVIDADPDAPVPWFATAYVAGPSLAEAVHEHGALPVPSVLTLAAGLAEGLSAIHAAGMVHRDLKPSNVLLAHDGPRVIDFGISRALDKTMLTQAGMVMGSPGFLSPEQAEGGFVGPPSDVFSLGAVLMFAATGAGPFGDGPTPALMYRVVNREPDLSGLPTAIQALVEPCLAKDPAERPTTGDLLTALGGGQLPVNWLPGRVAASLGRYAAPGGPGQDNAPATEDVAVVVPVGRAPAEPARRAVAASAQGVRRPRPAWLMSAATVVLAVAATAVVLNALGYRHVRSKPTAHSGGALQGATQPAKPSLAAGRRTAALPRSATAPAESGPSATASRSSASPAASPPALAQAPAPTPSQSAPPPPSTGDVPDVLGITLPAASSALKARGFDNIPYVYDCYGSADIDGVVRQSPEAGTQISPASPVQLYLQADNCATVPNVIGMALSDAAYTLKQDGFTNIPYVYGCYGSAQIDAVVSESPGAGTSYGESEPVSLRLQADNC